MNPPTTINPLTAPFDADPYPYYATLVSTRPFYWDAAMGMWICSSANAIEAAFGDPGLGVRPTDSLVPTAIASLSSGDLFGRWVRMRDDDARASVRAAMRQLIVCVSARLPATLEQALALARSADPSDADVALDRLMYRLPAYALGLALGVPPSRLEELAGNVTALVKGTAPNATTDELRTGAEASERLSGIMRETLSEWSEPAGERLGPCTHAAVGERRETTGIAVCDDLLANVVGVFWQSHDAMAGLIGNMTVWLARDPQRCRRVAQTPTLASHLTNEVLRWDPPIHNTRRWASRTLHIGGQVISAGDAVLLVIAAANRDPSFALSRATLRLDGPVPSMLSFGIHRHACMASVLATSIATAVIPEILGILAGTGERTALAYPRYVPLGNARIPHFTDASLRHWER